MRVKKEILPIPIKYRCVSCKGGNIKRVKNRTGSGAYQVIDMCMDCLTNSRGSAIYVSHKQAGLPLEEIPLWVDYTKQNPPCYVCGSQEGTELHHFAPRHIFPDEAELWPKEYLCAVHHRQWHETIALHYQDNNCKYCKGLVTKGKANGKG